MDVDFLCRGLLGKWHAVDGVPALTPIVHPPISIYYLDDACGGFGAGVFAYQSVGNKELDLIDWYRLSGIVELILVVFDSAGDGEVVQTALLCIDGLGDGLAIVGGGCEVIIYQDAIGWDRLAASEKNIRKDRL